MPYKDPEQQKKYQREWCAKRRAEYLEDKSCVLCGSTYKMEVDHIDPKTKLSHNVWSWSKVRREAELAKCQVLCQPHHFEKNGAALRKCGTPSRYRAGCHCMPCTVAYKADNKIYNDRRRERQRL